jgi:hypothetical protein
LRSGSFKPFWQSLRNETGDTRHFQHLEEEICNPTEGFPMIKEQMEGEKNFGVGCQEVNVR